MLPLLVLSASSSPRQQFTATISNASSSTHIVDRMTMGCHLDSGFGQELSALRSNLIFSPSFEYGNVTGPTNASSAPVGVGWLAVDGITAAAGVTFVRTGGFHGESAVRLTPAAQQRVGIANRGMGREGLVFEGGKPYEGYLYVKTDATHSAPRALVVTMEDYTDASGAPLPATAPPRVLATAMLQLKMLQLQSTWTRLNFTLTPLASTRCVGIPLGSDPLIPCSWKAGTDNDTSAHVCVRCGGQIVVALAPAPNDDEPARATTTFTTSSAPAALLVDFVYVEPGEWGRFRGLHVQKRMAEALLEIGTTMFRAGGTVNGGMWWKDWRGPIWSRAPYIWRNNDVSGFGPFEILDLCAAAGIVPIMTTGAVMKGVMSGPLDAEELGDLVEYAWGDASTKWGRIRIEEDAHPDIYNVTWFELGNEEQNPDFAAQVAAMERRAAAVGLAPKSLTYLYPWGGGGAGVGGPKNASQTRAINALGLAERIAVDDHVYATGGIPAARAVFEDLTLGQRNGGGGWGAINLETNCGDHTMYRALSEAQDLMQFFAFNELGKEGQRLQLGRAASFCMERAGYNSGGWNDQGLIFFLPNMTWLQPPGHVHAMIDRAWQSNARRVVLSGGDVGHCAKTTGAYPAGPCVDVAAQASDDGGSVSVQLLNMHPDPIEVQLIFASADVAANARANVTARWLHADSTGAVNTPAAPSAVAPYMTKVDLVKPVVLPPFSFVVLEVEGVGGR